MPDNLLNVVYSAVSQRSAGGCQSTEWLQGFTSGLHVYRCSQVQQLLITYESITSHNSSITTLDNQLELVQQEIREELTACCNRQE